MVCKPGALKEGGGGGLYSQKTRSDVVTPSHLFLVESLQRISVAPPVLGVLSLLMHALCDRW